jgi:sugar phosphate permease
MGLMTDRIGPRKILCAALAVVTLGTFTIAAADSYLVLMVGKIVMSCGMACIYIPLTKIIVVWFTKKDFATLNGFVIAAGNFAGIMALEPSRILLDSIGWRSLFLTLGVAAMVLALLCAVFVYNRPRDVGGKEINDIYPEEREVHDVYEKVPFRNGIAAALRGGRAFWMPAGAYFFVFGAMMLFQGRWGPKYFNTVYDFAITGATLLLFLAVGKLIATAIAGPTANRIGSKRTVMFSACLGYLAMWLIIWLFAGKADTPWFWAGICFFFGLFSGFMSIGFAMAKEGFPAAMSATVLAMYNTIIFLGGGVLQTLSIWIIDEKMPVLGQFTTMWMIAAVCVAAACVFSYFSVDGKAGKVRTADGG